MPRQALTDARVKRLEPRQSDFIEWCGQDRGFGVRVWPAGLKSPTGRKTFIAMYRAKGSTGAAKRVTIGTFPTMGVEEARKAAKEILAKAALGQDVAAERAKRKAALTMAELCDEYLAKGCGHKKASTVATDRGRIERHIKPLLGKVRINEITKANVKQFVADVADGTKIEADVKTSKHGRAMVKGGKGAATRTLRLLGGIFTYAIERGYIETSPRAGVKGFEDKRNIRWLKSDELARLGDALREAETVGLPWQLNEGPKAKHRPHKNQREPISPNAAAAIRLLLLTGCRLREILHLRWQDVDFERASIHLADSKTGAKDVYLSAPALKVLADIPRIEGSAYVIAGTKDGKPRSDLKRPWARVTAYAGLDGLRLHDLRHSYASTGAASGMGLLIVGKLLGHASTITTERYAHIANNPLRQANETIGEQIDAALSGMNYDNILSIVKSGNHR